MAYQDGKAARGDYDNGQRAEADAVGKSAPLPSDRKRERKCKQNELRVFEQNVEVKPEIRDATLW
jgi:hypothetical protein